jgi:hypothetical protein
MHLTVGGTELTLDNSRLVCVHKSHDLNSNARLSREMITAFLGRRKRLVWLVANPSLIFQLLKGNFRVGGDTPGIQKKASNLRVRSAVDTPLVISRN